MPQWSLLMKKKKKGLDPVLNKRHQRRQLTTCFIVKGTERKNHKGEKQLQKDDPHTFTLLDISNVTSEV